MWNLDWALLLLMALHCTEIIDHGDDSPDYVGWCGLQCYHFKSTERVVIGFILLPKGLSFALLRI